MQHHQAYQPLLPCVNKYLQYKWDRSCYEMHKKRVQSAKAMVNTTPPLVYGHLLVKRKKIEIEEERLSTIQRENQMLLEKICHIMRTTGRIDCKNDYLKKSLCADKRQQELLQIIKENQVIFKRLSLCTPNYSVERWQEQWLHTLNLMEGIGCFPRLRSTQASSGAPSQKHLGKATNKSKKLITKQEDSLNKEKVAMEFEGGEEAKPRESQNNPKSEEPSESNE